MKLQANNVDTGKTVTLNEQNGWSVTGKDLPAVDEDGNTIHYTWTEHTIPGYECVVTKNVGGTTIFVNRYRPLTLPDTDGTGGKTVFLIGDYDTALGVEVIINHVGDCYE